MLSSIERIAIVDSIILPLRSDSILAIGASRFGGACEVEVALLSARKVSIQRTSGRRLNT